MSASGFTAERIVKELAKLGSAGYKRTMLNHGAVEPYFGVKISELKKYQKKIKKDYQLAIDLYASGIGDAMYLAGLIADEDRMTKKDLQRWMKQASWEMISDYTVAWVAAESQFGRELGLEWIDSDDERVAAAGWSTLSSMVAVKPDDELNLKELEKLIGRVVKTIHASPNRARYTMNGFIIAVGCYVAPLSEKAVAAAEKIGEVEVDMGDTSCKVPAAAGYIAKVAKMKRIGRKRATARC
ncbi:MAG TPA: DNA alkylation repair protein [Phycisphaerae bacterium]|nr:DNA alkylation repair protein [Phycisphaerae bacterium]